ncbi:MAG: cupin domain-containing protein [Candidatus Humimicrobiaceae bacterium]
MTEKKNFEYKNITEEHSEENDIVFIKRAIEKDNYRCLFIELKPGKAIPSHIHAYSNQSFIFLEGEGELTINKARVKATRDIVVFFESGSEHSLRNSGNSNLKYIEITI